MRVHDVLINTNISWECCEAVIGEDAWIVISAGKHAEPYANLKRSKSGGCTFHEPLCIYTEYYLPTGKEQAC